jgi:crotonobetainyl-CoA:carnitine CoA-transferase CaiB-like acyl-CoA transferase
MGNAHPSIFPYEPFPVIDGEVVIAAANDGQFRKLCEVLGVSELADDERFKSAEGRNRHREALWPLLVEALGTSTAAEWSARLSAVGVPCSPVNTLAEGFDLANSLGLNPVVALGDDSHSVPMVRNPIDFSATPPNYHRPPPQLGEHSWEIRRWLEETPEK